MIHRLGEEWAFDATPAAPSAVPVYESRPDGSYVFGFASDAHLCFPAKTPIETKEGSVAICRIKVGDMVLTHKNRYRRVNAVVRSQSDGKLIRIRFRGSAKSGQNNHASIACTPNHPILVVRGGREGFVPAILIRPGDAVRSLGHKCTMCDTLVPSENRVCKEHDPFVRDSSARAKHAQRRVQHLSTPGSKHYVRDIVPEMDKWKKDGWRIIPTERVRPDFIAIRDGRVLAVEVESPESGRPRPIYEKYDYSGYREAFDDVVWIERDNRTRKVNRKYEWIEANEHGFVGRVVSSIEDVRIKPQRLYNLVVEEDETYVAKRCVVHNCSKYERLDCLNDLYDRFVERGVDRVINAGNWIDGEARFNVHDLHVHGMDAQCKYLAENFPQRDGIVTYAVAGDDHEGWYGQRFGVDIGRHAERIMQDHGRTDWVNLGYMESFISLRHARSGKRTQMLAMHPGGGSAYALSYRPQKIVESFAGGEKPAVLVIGHYHKLSYNVIRNVHAVQSGATQDQTPFMRKKSIDAHVGGGICELFQDAATGAITRCRVEFFTYYNLGFYNSRWSHGGSVTLPDRGAKRSKAA